MGLNKETETIGTCVASCIFSHFNVPMDSLYDLKGKYCNKVARMYVYYILHNDYNISSKQISYFMKKSQRNVLRCIAKLKFQINFFEEERAVYNTLIEKIKEKLSCQ